MRAPALPLSAGPEQKPLVPPVTSGRETKRGRRLSPCANATRTRGPHRHAPSRSLQGGLTIGPPPPAPLDLLGPRPHAASHAATARRPGHAGWGREGRTVSPARQGAHEGPAGAPPGGRQCQGRWGHTAAPRGQLWARATRPVATEALHPERQKQAEPQGPPGCHVDRRSEEQLGPSSSAPAAAGTGWGGPSGSGGPGGAVGGGRQRDQAQVEAG